LALHNYHDAFQVFPPACLNPGTRVLIPSLASEPLRNHTGYLYLLPFLEQTTLHDQIDFGKATGRADRNGPTAPNFPAGEGIQAVLNDVKLNVFRCPSDPPWGEPHTLVGWADYASDNFTRVSYGFVSATEDHGLSTVWKNDTNQLRSAFGYNGAARLADIQDGTSNTIVMIETPFRKSFPNASATLNDKLFGPFFQGYAHTFFIVPRNGGINQNKDGKGNPDAWGAGSRHPAGCQALFGDASVHYLDESISIANLQALVSVNGGEIVNLP